jgi:flagellar biosynthetic protein FliO
MRGTAADFWKGIPIVLIFGVLFCFPLMAQKGKPQSKPGTAVATAPAPPEPESPAVQEAGDPVPNAATSIAAASPDASTSADAAESSPMNGWGEFGTPLLQTAGSAGLVICLILGGFFLFRRFAPQYLNKPHGDRSLRLIETLTLGDKRSLVLVQAGTRKLLLASTPGQISMLTSFADLASEAPVSGGERPEPEVPAALSGSFRNLYEMEKKPPAARPRARAMLPPDIRGKMLELRKALEG